MKTYWFHVALATVLAICCSTCTQPFNPGPPALVPIPQEVLIIPGRLDFSKGLSLEIKDPQLQPLKKVIDEDYQMLFDKERREHTVTLRIDLNRDMYEDAYAINIDDDIQINGGSYLALASALTTLWQAADAKMSLPKIVVRDQPDYTYRSIMLDVARAWHRPETIRRIIDLCRWYKINYLHLHLTDDSAFSFPSDAYPQLATEGHSYTKDQLLALNEYAYERGVILVPEIDVPGHSSQFVAKMPELFGIQMPEKNPYTITMGREETYRALETIIGEVASVFSHSPYIHIGGDEAFFGGMEDDPDMLAYMAEHQLPNMHELFLHFLIRMNEFVKRQGKQTIVWAGFGERGELQIPNDVIVMLWQSEYHDPRDLLEKEYPIINASFKPLYVVNNRKWSPEYIYRQWHPNRWEHWANEGDFVGQELPENQQTMGATMCAWEQSQLNQLPRLRHRVASMAQQLWSGKELDWSEFSPLQKRVDEKFEKLTMPFKVQLDGLSYPQLEESNFYEHLWFDKELKIEAQATQKGLSLQYALKAEPSAADWQEMKGPLTINDNQHVHIRAIKADGQMMGRAYYQSFFLQPVKISTEGEWKELPIGSWEKHRFEDTLWVSLTSQGPAGIIRFRTDGQAVTKKDTPYTGPVPFTSTTHLRAQLFDKNGSPIGSAVSESYFKIWNEPSLTTGTPIKASNDHLVPGKAEMANNGRISLWEMWGDHKGEENWVQVDLQQVEQISRLKVYTFWDNWRYYQYNIQGSLDEKNWKTLVDFSQNTLPATEKGYEHLIESATVRYLRINMLYNSANPGLHLVELGAFEN